MIGRCVGSLGCLLSLAAAVQAQTITVELNSSWAVVASEHEGMNICVAWDPQLLLRANWNVGEDTFDISEACDWFSSDPNVIVSLGAGSFDVVGCGTVEITAVLGAVVSDPFELTIHESFGHGGAGFPVLRESGPPVSGEALRNQAQLLLDGLPSEMDVTLQPSSTGEGSWGRVPVAA